MKLRLPSATVLSVIILMVLASFVAYAAIGSCSNADLSNYFEIQTSSLTDLKVGYSVSAAMGPKSSASQEDINALQSSCPKQQWTLGNKSATGPVIEKALTQDDLDAGSIEVTLQIMEIKSFGALKSKIMKKTISLSGAAIESSDEPTDDEPIEPPLEEIEPEEQQKAAHGEDCSGNDDCEEGLECYALPITAKCYYPKCPTGQKSSGKCECAIFGTCNNGQYCTQLPGGTFGCSSTLGTGGEPEPEDADDLLGSGEGEEALEDDLEDDEPTPPVEPDPEIDLPLVEPPQPEPTTEPSLRPCNYDTVLSATCSCTYVGGPKECTAGKVCTVLKGCQSKSAYESYVEGQAETERQKKKALAGLTAETDEDIAVSGALQDCNDRTCSVIRVQANGPGTNGWTDVRQGKPLGVEPGSDKKYKVKIWATKQENTAKCLNINGKEYSSRTKRFTIYREASHKPWQFRIQGFTDNDCTVPIPTAKATVSFFAKDASDTGEVPSEADIEELKRQFELLTSEAAKDQEDITPPMRVEHANRGKALKMKVLAKLQTLRGSS